MCVELITQKQFFRYYCFPPTMQFFPSIFFHFPIHLFSPHITLNKMNKNYLELQNNTSCIYHIPHLTSTKGKLGEEKKKTHRIHSKPPFYTLNNTYVSNIHLIHRAHKIYLLGKLPHGPHLISSNESHLTLFYRKCIGSFYS